MNLNQLSYFIQVCDSGSFSKAASKNFISPQGISINISRLEREIGAKLFKRTSSGVLLTADGKYLYDCGKEILELVDECNKHFKKRSGVKQMVTLYYTPEFACALPPTFFALILEKYFLDIHTGGSLTCEESVLSGDGDYAFVNGPYFNKSLDYWHCFTRQHCLITHRDNPLVSRRDLRLADLKDCRFIMPDHTYKLNLDFHEMCRKLGFTPDIAFMTPSFSTIYALLKQNKTWIGYSFDFYVDQNVDHDIVRLDIKDLNWPWDVYFAQRKDEKDELSPFAQDVINFFQAVNQKAPISQKDSLP